MSDLVADLAAAVGADHVHVDPVSLSTAATDWTGRFRGSTPAVVAPADAHEVAAVVDVCRRRRVGIVPQGGNTGLVAGATPFGHVVVSTRRLVDVGPVDEDAGQVTVSAGVSVGTLQAAATAAGWRYAVDLAARDSATIGGTIATNAGGVHVIRFGDTRRQLLGVEAVLGTGDVVSRLDGLVKDNTGYDLAGLLCGSEGTLGIVTRARLALVAPSTGSVTALVSFDSLRAALRAVGRIRRDLGTVDAVELMLRDGVDLVADTFAVRSPVSRGAAVLLVESPEPLDAVAAVIGGLDGVVDSAVADDTAGRDRMWALRELHTEAIGMVGVPLKFDVTLQSATTAAVVDRIVERVASVDPAVRTWLFGHAADGNVHVNVTGADVADAGAVTAIEEAVLGEVVAAGGSVSAEHGIGRAKRRWLERNRSAGDVAAMRRIKTAFDPDGILNPGVLV